MLLLNIKGNSVGGDPTRVVDDNTDGARSADISGRDCRCEFGCTHERRRQRGVPKRHRRTREEAGAVHCQSEGRSANGR